MIEYRLESIRLFSNRIFIMIMLVLNFTESPIPSRMDCFVPSSFLPIIQLPRIFEPFDINIINIIKSGETRR